MDHHQTTFERYKKKATDILGDNDRVKNLLINAKDKIVRVVNHHPELKEFSNNIHLLIRMVKAQFSGIYTEYPWNTSLMIVGALLYFVMPLDLIPDFIPALGFADDLSIVYWIYQSIQEDIEKFQNWENTIEIA